MITKIPLRGGCGGGSFLEGDDRVEKLLLSPLAHHGGRARAKEQVGRRGGARDRELKAANEASGRLTSAF